MLTGANARLQLGGRIRRLVAWSGKTGAGGLPQALESDEAGRAGPDQSKISMFFNKIDIQRRQVIGACTLRCRRPKRRIMRLIVEQIGEEGLDLVLEPEARSFPVLETIRKRGEVVFESPIRFEIRAVRADALVYVQGRFAAFVRLACSRCLARYRTEVAERFSLTYAPRKQMPEQQRPGEEVEVSDDEVDLTPFDGDQIDLTEGLQEQLVMALPLKPLCSDDCKGICPRCGADLNQGPCNCPGEEVDPRLAVLAKLKVE